MEVPMATLIESRACRRQVGEWSVVRDDDPGLRALYSRARQLIADLERGADNTALGHSVRAYVDCAVAQGISRARITDALELLVYDHARDVGEALPKRHGGTGTARRRRESAARVFERVLQLAASVSVSGGTWPMQPGSRFGVGESS
jgi:hypothetical protein